MPQVRNTVRSRKPPETPAETPVSQPMTDLLPEFGTNLVSRRRPAGRGFLKGAALILLIVAAAGALGYLSSSEGGLLSVFRREKPFSAVFLNNGQVYFGQIQSEDARRIVLKNVFYVQLVEQQVPSSDPDGVGGVQQVPQLVKKGEEFYQPEDTIEINRSQVSVIERLKPESQIMQDIRARLQ